MTKQQSIGTCDHCRGPIARDEWYTSKGKPRLYCCRDCRNTANSRAGAAERGRQARERVKRGEWQNPAELNPPDPAKVSAGISRSKKAAVERGEWVNPALNDDARAKLSRPRKHDGALASAIERLSAGETMQDLTDAEVIAYREYRQQLRDEHRDEINQQYRERYRKRQASMTDEQREAQRQKWREANKRKRG